METKFTKADWKVTYRNNNDMMVTYHGVTIGNHYLDIATANERADALLIAAAPKLYKTLDNLLNEILDLMGESDGVYGLHLNGDVSPWGELDEGGRFERLTSLSEAVAALKQARGEDV